VTFQHKLQSANAAAPVKLCGRQFSGHGILSSADGLRCHPTNQPFCLKVGNVWLPGNFPQQ
jgi:hypothetical protein